MSVARVSIPEKSDAYAGGLGIAMKKWNAYVKGSGIAVEKVECLYRRVRYGGAKVDMPILN